MRWARRDIEGRGGGGWVEEKNGEEMGGREMERRERAREIFMLREGTETVHIAQTEVGRGSQVSQAGLQPFSSGLARSLSGNCLAIEWLWYV